ncbi:MAG: hypothetical protein QM820_61355 [Minicystis sp.]
MSEETGNDRPAEGAPPQGDVPPEIPAAPPAPPLGAYVPPPIVRRPWWSPIRAAADYLLDWGRAYFLERDPTFWSALGIFALLCVILYSRWVTTNFIFDEQEALLANPYVNATQNLRFVDAIHRDFWGLLPDRSIGSYRPIPNFLWRIVWQLSKSRDGVFRQAFIHHIENVLLHGVNAALMTVVTFAWTKRRGLAWIAGFIFAACALLTEAVSGIVGIADVLGGMGAILALWALSAPAWAMPFAVFTAISFGLFSKESAVVCVPLVPFAALLLAPLTHPTRPARFARAALAFVGAAAAFYLYVELRKKWFPSPLPKELTEPLPDGASWAQRTARAFLVWFHQAPLPKDPLNNPLVKADSQHRIAGALRVYFRGLVQIVFPRPLSGDYSFRQEPIPDALVFRESIAGGIGMLAPPVVSAVIWIVALWRERRERIGAADLGGGMRGDLLGTVLRGLGVAALCVVPALVLRGLVRGVPADEVLRPGNAATPFILGPPMVAALLWTASALITWRRAQKPGADRGNFSLRLAGFAVVFLALGIAVAEILILPPLGVVLAWRGIPLWVVAIPLFALGAGMLIDGAPRLADPFFPATSAPRPLGLAGILLIGLGITWVVVSYFPHSNIPVVLPTVRAERFWYFPAIGSTLVLAVVFTWLFDIESRRRVARVAPAFVALFMLFQCVQAYRHAMDYRSDVDFWRATKDAVPLSAKAHLNYSVMKGARGDLQTRLEESKIAMALAPDWAMAHIYTGDTLCRMHRAPEAWEHYAKGFHKGPDDSEPDRARPAVPLRREAARRARGRAAHHRRGPPGIVGRVPGARHPRQPREEQGRRSQVPAARIQRRSEGVGLARSPRRRRFRRRRVVLLPDPAAGQEHPDRAQHRGDPDQGPHDGGVPRPVLRAEAREEVAGGRPDQELRQEVRQRRQAYVGRLAAARRDGHVVLVEARGPEGLADGQQHDHRDLEAHRRSEAEDERAQRRDERAEHEHVERPALAGEGRAERRQHQDQHRVDRRHGADGEGVALHAGDVLRPGEVHVLEHHPHQTEQHEQEHEAPERLVREHLAERAEGVRLLGLRRLRLGIAAVLEIAAHEEHDAPGDHGGDEADPHDGRVRRHRARAEQGERDHAGRELLRGRIEERLAGHVDDRPGHRAADVEAHVPEREGEGAGPLVRDALDGCLQDGRRGGVGEAEGEERRDRGHHAGRERHGEPRDGREAEGEEQHPAHAQTVDDGADDEDEERDEERERRGPPAGRLVGHAEIAREPERQRGEEREDADVLEEGREVDEPQLAGALQQGPEVLGERRLFGVRVVVEASHRARVAESGRRAARHGGRAACAAFPRGQETDRRFPCAVPRFASSPRS